MKVGFFGLLAILFIGLKLGNVIAWSWWWVMAPLWGGLVLGVVVVFFVCIFAAISIGLAHKKIGRMK